ncbi:MAG: ATP-binding protein, partial [Pseudomonadota bacterium]
LEGRRSERLSFEVSDTGVGIPLAAQSQIFERFRQVEESARRTHEGAGLGLSIAKGIVDAMGGELTVRSTPGVGSTFRFDLVLETEASAADAA